VVSPVPSYASKPAEEDFLPGRVLVVEDDDLQARQIVDAIQSLGDGWSAIRVSGPVECLKVLESTTFSLALVDHVLPDGDGLKLLQEMRGRGYVVATVLMTAHGSEKIAVEALRLGVADYLPKDGDFLRDLPYTVARIVAQHRRALRKVSAYSRIRMELAQRTHRGLLDSFAAPIVHDIKSPLSCIITAADLILPQGGRPGAPAADMVTYIRKSAKKIEELLERLLRFARQETEERVSQDLSHLLMRIAMSELEPMRLQNIRLVREIPPEPVRARVAPKAIEQLVLNLLANASEALVMASGGGVVSMSLALEAGNAVITVSDNGPGIPADVLPALFRPFSTFGKAKGTGLGLCIGAGVVREHGGHIHAQNVPSGGARFTVRLPLEDHGPVALLLEDEPHIQELMATQLELLGIRADVYEDGDRVLPVLAEGRWDLVLLDIRTPRINGVRIFQEMLARRPDLVPRTMVVSGSIADRDLQQILADHPVPCLPKPYEVSQFNDMVRLLLRRPGERSEP
jgi:signal transduction histidine kinase